MRSALSGFLVAPLLLVVPSAAAAASPPGAIQQLSGEAGCIVDEPHADVPGCANVGRALEAPSTLAVSPDGRNVYATASDSHALVSFDRDAETGALTQKPNEAGCIVNEPEPNVPFCANTGRALAEPSGVTVSPDGATVYVTTTGSDSISIFDRNQTTGVLTQKTGAEGCIVNTPAPDVPDCDNIGSALDGAFLPVVSPGGESVYVVSLVSDSVTTFDRHTVTGVITQKPGANGCLVNGPSVDVGGCDNTGLALDQPTGIAVRPGGGAVYVTSAGNHSVSKFERDVVSGNVTQNQCIVNATSAPVAGCDNTGRALAGAFAATVSPTGSNVYVAAQDSGAVSSFDATPATGALTQKSGAAGCLVNDPAADVAGCDNTGRGLGVAQTLEVSSDGRSLYVAGFNEHAVAVLDRDPAGGSVAQKPLATGCVVNEPSADVAGCDNSGRALLGTAFVTVSPDGRNVYSAAFTGDAVSTFRRDLVPVCEPVSAVVAHNQATGVPLRCSDPNGDAITLAPGAPTSGAVGQAGGSFLYTPTTGFAGAASFTYTATANGATSDPATASLQVLPGSAPVCAPRSQSVRPDTGTTLALVCAAGGDPFTYAIAGGPANGSLGAIDQANALVSYTPNAGHAGPDSFTYAATSAFGTSSPATFALDVFPPQQAGAQAATPTPNVVPPQQPGAERLLVELVQRNLRARAGKRVQLRYVSTLPAGVRLVMRRGQRVVARRSVRARAGANAIAVTDRRPGLYRLQLTATVAEQSVSRSATLRLTRRR